MNTISRELPIGIQDFEKLRTNNYLYVDKTALVYNLASKLTPFFLSRPRRFGKSLLLSTFKAYFLGRKDLFEGLAIEKLETEWTEYPVLHISLGRGWYKTVEDLQSRLDECLQPYEELYDVKAAELAPDRFYGLIRRACQQTGKRVVVLIDEYDKPLLEALHDDDLEAEYLRILRGFYNVLKDADQYLRFIFLTGVTKFGKVSIFSDLNQLNDISMDAQYATICGITKEELIDTFTPELERLAERHDMTFEETVDKMTRTYDGYHFGEDTPGLYNPFSILNVLSKNKFKYYWFQTGTPTYLVKLLKNSSLDMGSLMDGIERIGSDTFTQYRADPRDPVPIFYQSGYLTIKHYNERRDKYTLEFPNDEVRYGFLNFLVPIYTKMTASDSKMLISHFVDALEAGDVDGFFKCLKAYYAGIPYNLSDNSERHYQLLFRAALTLMGQLVDTEVHSARGRADAIVKTDDYIYVFEFKLNDTADAAMEQINDRGYAEPYAVDGREVIKIGVKLNKETRNVERYIYE